MEAAKRMIDDDGRHSPCRDCPREHKNKNFGRCKTCKRPARYVQYLERLYPYSAQAIDYREVYSYIVDRSVVQ